MARIRTLRSPAEIEGILDRFEDSDLSVAAFCREEGLPTSSVRLWLRKRAEASALSDTTALLRRVTVTPGPADDCGRPGLELVFPSGVRLRIQGVVDPDQLELVIGTVLSCSS
ncbi:MAG: hypothetical protein D6692_09795 [Planctomycetota bacterium]|nr:MAG: hypothetical protein D6692_09795 [Planctomycetota bacterium]